jgi:Asp-tRNA(Asn)/Glu-tRNA(Gln) amidotransferase A subunit family amidase
MGEPAATRRQLLHGSWATALAALSGCRPHAAGATADLAPGPSHAEGPITSAEIAAAERVAGVRYTANERQQLVDAIESQLDALRARRKFVPENDEPPATVFDPRPSGFRPPVAAPTGVVLGTAAPGLLPSDPADIAYAPVSALGHWLRSGALTSVRLTEIYLERLERLGPRLECVVTLTPELALRQAAAADAELAGGHPRGPLHGIPWGAKDLFDTAGIETSWGAETHRGRVPPRDAIVVERLREAGAVLVAKLSLGALAYGDIWYGGRTRNPWNLEEGSSGSSAGSGAAVAAGLVGFALGTETLGSIVSPSMRNGTCGLRPTFGRVARTGTMALCWSLDKIGPLGRHAECCAAVLGAIDGGDASDPSSVPAPAFGYDGRAHDPADLADLRIGYDPAWFQGDERTRALDRSVLERLRGLRAQLVELSLPDLPYAGLAPILLAEAAACFEALTLEDRDDALRWQDPEAWPNTWRLARLIPAVDLVQADRLRRRVVLAMHETFERAGVALLVAPSFGPLLTITNYTGHPSLTLPVGTFETPTRSLFDEPGEGPAHRVPHGITLTGRLFEEATLVRVGRALELALGVADLRPPIG